MKFVSLDVNLECECEMLAAKTKKRRNPNYAIVKISESVDVIAFYQLLLEHGYNEVSFVNAVSENTFLLYAGAEKDAFNSKNGDLQSELSTRPENESNGMSGGQSSRRQSLANSFAADGDAVVALFDDGNSTAPAFFSGNEQLSGDSPPIAFNHNDVNNGVGDGSSNLLAQLIMGSFETVASDNKADGVISKNSFKKGGKSARRSPATAAETSVASTGPTPSTIDAPVVVVSVRERPRQNAALFAMNEPLRAENSTAVDGSADDGGAAADEDSGAFATCLLCRNRIMSSRLSNLTNHVRRHASMKQFQCTQCSYSHNEQAKVRLHMNHNHEDFNSQPVDRLCFEMQLQWNQLMEQCFPEHAKRSKDSEYWKLASAGAPSTSSTDAAKSAEPKALAGEEMPPPQQWQHACTACGEMLTRQRALAHIRERHHAACIMFTCTTCGYRGIEHRYARVHASVKHPSEETYIEALPPGNHEMFMKRYFPTLMFTPEDESSLADKGETFACKLCGNAFSASSSALLVHAKNHCREKQFRCTECDYASIDRRSARSHMQSCHNTDREPFDALNAKLKKHWISMVRKCFPHVSNEEDDDYSFLDVDLRKGRRRADHRNRSNEPLADAGDCLDTTALTPRETLRLLCARRISAKDEISPQASVSPIEFDEANDVENSNGFIDRKPLKREVDDGFEHASVAENENFAPRRKAARLGVISCG